MKNAAELPASIASRAAFSPQEIWRSTRLWFIPYIFVALGAIFYLPRLLPPTSPTASDSYLFGYNNRIGILLLLFFVALGVVLTRGFRLGGTSNSLADRRLPRWILAASFLIIALGCAAMYALAGRYHGFGESFYLIDRIALLDQGRTPYRDFEFVYGPAQLYGPLFLHRLLPLSIADAYYLFWALSYLLGAFLLFKTIDELTFPTPAKSAVFALLYFAGLFAIVRMGTNYTFLRYALPLYLVVKLNARFRDTRAPRLVSDVLVCAAYCTLLVLFSPETAVAFAFASGCMVLFCRSIPLSRKAVIAALLIVAYAVIFAAALKLHILDAMLADGGGAISFPIVPGLTILVYFAALFITACWLYRCLVSRTPDDPTLGLLFYSVPMIAAALGRCDPSHVFWNGLATFLASLLYISLFRRAWPIYATAFMLCVFVAPNLSELYLFFPQLRSAHDLNNHPKARPTDSQINAFLASWPGSYVAPFGFRPDGFGTIHSPRIEYGAYEDLIDVSTPHSVQRKVSELRADPTRALILPYRYDEYCITHLGSEKSYLSVLLLSPYIGKVAHRDFARQPICRYIDDHYQVLIEPSGATWSYGIWIPSANR
ncbi:hypothetical protein [Occallatibacter savannae]|uniref:hypothetical protein n=1 Tax=Occallatibacter savannae TaxID=1002691 RepID=UPI000D689F6A|nr:hypothetical protein [Occallatibacter savannae]